MQRIFDMKPEHESLVVARLANQLRRTLATQFPQLKIPAKGSFADDEATVSTQSPQQPSEESVRAEKALRREPGPPPAGAPKASSASRPLKRPSPREFARDDELFFGSNPLSLSSTKTTMILLSLVLIAALTLLVLLLR